MEKAKLFIKNNILIIGLIVVMGFVYGVEMFRNKPWYDELYTYYYFISRGPVYAGIHWPVPNNHLGYSVLSAFLDYLGNNTIGLRGISWIASLCNISLVYNLVRKIYSKVYGYIAALIFVMFGLVNTLAIQGRGYAVATTCMLTALMCVYKICLEDGQLRCYIVFVLSLVWGLYTIPSSCYWVVTVCFIGGAYTLFRKDYKSMRKLIGFAVIAAVLTFVMYGTVWLAIGSNLLSKDAESAYFGIYQVTIILHHPLAALKTGMDYMLATPYIQSIDRSIVVKELPQYLKDLFELYVTGWGNAITVILIIGFVVSIIDMMISRNKEDGRGFFASIFVSLFVLMMPVVLIGQSVQPYKRVFSFYGVCVSFIIIYLIKCAAGRYFENKINQVVISALVTLAVIVTFATGTNRTVFADRENDLKEAFDLVYISDNDSIFYTDDYQMFVLKFYYDVMPVEAAAGEATYMVVSKDYVEDFEVPQWPILYSSEDMKQMLDKDTYKNVAETDAYVIYQKQTD